MKELGVMAMGVLLAVGCGGAASPPVAVTGWRGIPHRSSPGYLATPK